MLTRRGMAARRVSGMSPGGRPAPTAAGGKGPAARPAV